ncbi:uncharacterized protein LOC127078827 [Lathyrus oleraceus]|uniref:uncharacterized protein LOC127078827 n=1 Tax=Pisum sativum TaxID=3888 RepID=UPI0021D06025|nr:uncharacterized protein LOC127078827 [Pisum sativum]
MLIFLHPSNKYPKPEDIDKIISAEVLDPNKDPKLYNLVKTHMVHGPCGLENLRSPYMKDGKCSKYYPKKFQPTTIVDQDGYPVYRRKDNGHTIDKNGIILHNGHVVPHNPSLLLKYEAHINMEWCNQSTSIKYLFKYINKGSDRISVVIQSSDENIIGEKKSIDEIKKYLNCRYISPSEACWRIFSYSIHDRKPIVERLFFHMEGENSVYYKDFEQIGNVLLKPSVTESMFTTWFEAKKIFDEDKLLTYELTLTDEEIKELMLIAIEIQLQKNNRSLKDFKPTSYPNDFVVTFIGNQLVYKDIYQHNVTLVLFVGKEKHIYSEVMDAVERQNGGVFFLYGYDGTGKTFMWNTLAATLRYKHKIVLPVASSEIASLLLLGGRTAHSRFKIPVPNLESSICNIDKKDELVDLLRLTNLIIWDETQMANKFCFEALDKSLKDIMSDIPQVSKKLFGGKCRVLKLTKKYVPSKWYNKEEVRLFSEWILHIGDDTLSEPDDGYVDISIPDEFIISNFSNPIVAIVESTYPDMIHNYHDPKYLQSRAILTSTIEVVDDINQYITIFLPSITHVVSLRRKEILSTTTDFDAFEHMTPKFLNALKTSGLPNHSIKLKIGTTIMLMHNLDQSEALHNGTRLTVTRFVNHVIEAKIISGKNMGNTIYVPRMSLSPSKSPWPFKLVRRQFPIIVSFAMTINKSQGQSLDNVGLYLSNDVFSHGQLYVAMSRFKSKQGLKI